MTVGNDVSRAPSAPNRAAVRKKRGGGIRAGFAIMAAAGLVAAYAIPTGAALAEVEPAVEAISAYDQAVDGAQSLSAADEVQNAVFSDRGTYEVYVTPPPPPPPTVSSSGGGGGGGSPKYSGGGSKNEWLAASGIAESDWGYVDYIAKRESGWNPNATNPSSGACGLIQAYPCSKVPGSGYNPVDNLRWANGYAIGRYGSWAKAYDFWTRNHWW